MVVTDSEMLSQGEVESPLASEQQQMKNHAFSSLGRQSSIYSLTLDEFQNTLCEGGKNFGSMNMDEFLNSIWTAEENQAQGTSATVLATNTNSNTNTSQLSLTVSEANTSTNHKGMITRQPSLARQGSLTLPGPLSRKTVEQVWAEIHNTQQEQPQTQTQSNDNISNAQNPGTSQQHRQVTFGEMTLEDFLVKAGIVREQCQPPTLPQQQQSYGSFYTNNNNTVIGSVGFVSRPVMSGVGGVGAAGGNVAGYQAMPQTGETGAAAAAYPVSMKRGGAAYASQQPTAACFGGRMGNGGSGGYGQVQGLGLGSPVSPVSSDGLCGNNQMDGANQYGMDIGGMRGSGGGRKRIIDGPIEKVVERRQRRMIKNRESAARSRARKQAYTVELEAELNQLKEDNAHLKEALALADDEKKRWQQLVETKFTTTPPRVEDQGIRAIMRRTSSSPH